MTPFFSAPNMMSTMAHAPAALEGYLAFSGALAKGAFDAKLRERIALANAQSTRCGYCLSAHTLLGKMAGLSEADALAARNGSTTTDARADAIVAFGRAVVSSSGHVSDTDLQKARAAGLTDADLAETVANVALNVYTNYFNHVADPEIDFPKVSL
jgi:AhpD family alkylhydroperoxidase